VKSWIFSYLVARPLLPDADKHAETDGATECRNLVFAANFFGRYD
jgi:hypothetical protein